MVETPVDRDRDRLNELSRRFSSRHQYLPAVQLQELAVLQAEEIERLKEARDQADRLLAQHCQYHVTENVKVSRYLGQWLVYDRGMEITVKADPAAKAVYYDHLADAVLAARQYVETSAGGPTARSEDDGSGDSSLLD